MKHPSHMDLFEYAEMLADKASAIPVHLAGHVARCSKCAKQVEAIRLSLTCMGSIPALEPSAESARQILAAAREERRKIAEKPRRLAAVLHTGWRIVESLACAAVILVMAGVSFRSVLNDPKGLSSRSGRISPPLTLAQTVALPSDVVKKASFEIGELANVLQETPRSQSPVEQRHRRFALAVRDDLAAATLALERNPGCERAQNMMTLNLARQADVLKRIYIERTL